MFEKKGKQGRKRGERWSWNHVVELDISLVSCHLGGHLNVVKTLESILLFSWALGGFLGIWAFRYLEGGKNVAP